MFYRAQHSMVCDLVALRCGQRLQALGMAAEHFRLLGNGCGLEMNMLISSATSDSCGFSTMQLCLEQYQVQ